ncbi:MAG: hypothetical protein DMD82_02145 [Candidatus Rokuibacteriota bacterium]|nr:MAG: hypothetical protein DMD82_02145 [Candidatus Rokubacteria bacterium]
MARERHVDALMRKLLHAIETSLSAAEAAREAVQEILKRGAETGIFFAGAKSNSADPSVELTAQDREFLRAVSIRPDGR